MTDQETLKSFLDQQVERFNQTDFIPQDPISIPHRYLKKEDIEIAGFLTATISWGNRKMILRNAQKMMCLMSDSPHDFILHHNENQLIKSAEFVHRTFNGTDLLFFIEALKNIYINEKGLEGIFNTYRSSTSIQPAIHQLKKIFFSIPHLARTRKHISDPAMGSAAKRINMFLRWMVRNDSQGVDFGLWRSIPSSILSCPLDVHSGRVARNLGLLSRKQDDAKAVEELDGNLRQLDRNDPVKYDFALFGLGASGWTQTPFR